MQHETSDTDETNSIRPTRRQLIATLAASGALAATASGQSDSGGLTAGGGPMADEMADARVKVYEEAEANLPDPGVVGRYVLIEEGGSQYQTGDFLEDTGDAWQLADLGVDELTSRVHSTDDANIDGFIAGYGISERPWLRAPNPNVPSSYSGKLIPVSQQMDTEHDFYGATVFISGDHIYQEQFDGIAHVATNDSETNGTVYAAARPSAGDWLTITGPSGDDLKDAHVYDTPADIDSDTKKASVNDVYRPLPGNLVPFVDRDNGGQYWMWGEYLTVDTSTEPNTRIVKIRNNGTVTYPLTLDRNTYRHIHTMARDPFDMSRFWASTGDADAGCSIWESNDWGDNWTEVANGSQYYRSVNIIPREQYLFWAMDGTDANGECFFVRAPKSDPSNYEALFKIGDESQGRLISQGVAYSRSQNAIIVTVRDSTDTAAGYESLPIWIYDLDTGEARTKTYPVDESVHARAGYEQIMPWEDGLTGEMYGYVKGRPNQLGENTLANALTLGQQQQPAWF